MRIVICDKLPARFLEEFRALGLEVDYQPEAGAEGVVAAAASANIVVVRSTKVSRKAIEGAKNLALIIRAGAGYDTIDVAAASERGIFVTNCPGKNSVAVAELTMGLIIALDRRIADNMRDLRAGQWNKKEYGKAEGLKGKVLGVAGTGPIGRAVIARAQAFEMRVVAWSRSLTPALARELGVEACATATELAERCDVVSVHLAQNAATKKMFGEAFFAKMKKGAMFVNTSRGGLVDQPALIQAMKDRGIRAGLDVFDPEPAEGACAFTHEIFGLPGFVGTHHIGASTEEAQNAIAAEAVRICGEFVRTGQVPNVVNVKQHATTHFQLIVRHHDKVGVLASVLEIIRKYDVNVEEMSNTLFDGARTAVAVLRLSVAASPAMVKEISELKDLVIAAEAKG